MHGGPIAVAGMAVLLSVLHAALPNHWLPFVLVGRALGWSRARTLGVVAVAGGGHVLATSTLGVLVWWTGESLVARYEALECVAALIAGGLLVALGLVYLAIHATGRHHHSHGAADAIWAEEHAAHEHTHESPGEHAAHAGRARAAAVSERGAILTLLIALTLSPCEAVVAVFLVGVKFGGFAYVIGLALAISLATVAAMFLLVWLTLKGVEKLEAPWLDRYELLVTGSILVAIGVAVLLLHG